MSWSVSAVGKAPAVRTAIAKQFESSSKCTEPEEALRQHAATIIDNALQHQNPTTVVEVTASGSMSFNYETKEATSNAISINIVPKWGWVE